jgi:hypothetical protein
MLTCAAAWLLLSLLVAAPLAVLTPWKWLRICCSDLQRHITVRGQGRHPSAELSRFIIQTDVSQRLGGSIGNLSGACRRCRTRSARHLEAELRNRCLTHHTRPEAPAHRRT